MADVNANININIDSSSALSNLRNLETKINQFQRTIGSSNAAAAASQAALNKALLDGINNTGLFTARQVDAIDSSARFSNALERNKLTLSEYSRFAASQLPGMSRIFRREFDTMEQVATSRVKAMNTQYVALGRTVDGVTRAIAATPTGLSDGIATSAAMASQKQMIFNKLIDDGSTKLLNWGKNTQWAGRQLMVGLTLPLGAMAAAASAAFMEIDKASTSLKRVYGDLSTTTAEIDNNLQAIKALGSEYTKYGIAVSDTIQIAARAAATGATNEELMAATEQTLRFATLGQIDYNQALDTTISLQTAFGVSNDELSSKIDFLNAVENQTILTIEDMSLAIPRVATVVKGLGGDVEDLAIMMTAMREGGVSAENAANGLKSGLASMINPTKQANEYLSKFGINLRGIVEVNKGNLIGTVQQFGEELNKLSDLDRQRALEKTFGKYQFARMSALFDNMTKKSGQAARAMDLAGMSMEDLASIADNELGKISESTTVKFQAALEKLKLTIAPIGEAFLKLATPVINLITNLAEAFNGLPDPIKNAMGIATAAIAGLGPILLMGIGLMGNLVANIIKGVQWWRKLGARIRGDASAFSYMSKAEYEAMAATEALEGSTRSLTGKLYLQKGAVAALTAEYQRFAGVAGIAAGAMGAFPGKGGSAGRAPRKMATGGMVPGKGNKDTVPALLTPGESVVTKDATSKYGSIIAAMNAGTIQGFAKAGGVGRKLPDPAAETKFMHATPNLPVSQEQASAIKRETTNKDITGAGRKIDYGLTNFGILGPNRFNENKMQNASGSEVAKLFTGSQSLLDYTMTPIYEGLANRLNIRGGAKAAMKDPKIRTAVSQLAASWAKNLNEIGAAALTETTFYASAKGAVASVEDKKIKKELNQMRTQMTTVQTSNRFSGDRSRVSISPPAQQKALGNEKPQVSYRGKYPNSSYPLPVPMSSLLSEKRMRDLGAENQSNYNAGANSVANPEKNDPAIRSRSKSRNSPHPLMPIDGRDDQRAYDNARQVEAKRNWKKSQSAQRQELGQIDRIPARRRELMAGAIRTASIGGGDRRQAIKSAKLAAQSRTDEEILAIIKQEDNERIAQSKKASAERKAARAASDKRLAAQERANQQQIERQVSSSNISENAIAANETRIEEESGRRRRRGSIGRRVSRGIRGGGGALGMASMVPFMAQNEQGQFMGMNANTLGMGMMGASMASQILPSLIPLLANPIGAAAAAITAAGAGFWLLNSQANNLVDSGKKLANAMYGSTQSIQDMANYFGKKTYEQKLTELRVSQITGKKQSEKTLGEAEQFVASEPGQKLLEEIKSVRETLGSDSAAKALSNQIQRAVLSGAMGPKMGVAVATAIGNSLKDTNMAVEVSAKIEKLIGLTGQNLDNVNSRMKIFADVVADATDINRAMNDAGLSWDGQGWIGQVSAIITGKGTADIAAANIGESLAQGQDIISQELSRNELAFQNNEISAQEFLETNKKILETAKEQGLTWKGVKDAYEKAYSEDLDLVDAIAQPFVERFFTTIQNSTSESIANGIKDGMTSVDVLELARVNQKDIENLPRGKDVLMNGLDIANAEDIRKAINDVTESINKPGSATQDQIAEWRKILATLQALQSGTMTLAIAVDSGQLSPEAAAAFLQNKRDGLVNLRIGALPDDQAASFFKLIDEMGGKGLAVDIAWNLVNTGDTEGMADFLLEIATGKKNKFNVDLLIETRGREGLSKANKLMEDWDKTPKKNRKDFIANYIKNNFGFSQEETEWFLGLDAKTQKTFVLNYLVNFDENNNLTAEGQIAIRDKFGIAPNAKGPSLYNNKEGVTLGLKASANPGSTEEVKPPKVPLVPEDKKDGGDTKSWLQQLIDDTQANMQIFPAMINKMKGRGIPDQIIEMIGAGEDGLKRAKEILGLSREKLNKLISDYAKTSVSQAINNTQEKINAARQKKKAEGILTDQGFSKEDAQTISANTEDVIAIINANSGKSKKSIGELVAKYRELIAVTKEAKTAEELYSESLDKFNQLRKMMEAGFDAAEEAKRVEFANQFKDANGKTVEEMEKQVSLNQRMIDAQQKIVDNKQEEINDYQRTNDLIQQGVEDLQRQDELRNRISSALSHELELMSNAENKIKAAYDQRIEALDKVQKINENIANQQKQQLSLAQALSTGDVYAAAAAAQEMQSSQAQSASDTLRSSLQQGMQNQIDSLRTSDGLTRAQAEEQINAIKEQSYQTSLLIRTEEDKIYQNNLEVRRLTNEIYNINENNIEPLQKQNEAYSQKLSYQQEDLENAIKVLTIAGLTRQQYEDEANALQDAIDNAKDLTPELIKLAGNYHAIYEEAKRAADETQRLGKSISNPGKSSATTEVSNSDILAAVKQTGGGMGLNFSTGGSVPKRYATGGQVGMDSVSAMLTPGEFVVRNSMVKKYGTAMFNSINQGSFSMPRYNMNSAQSTGKMNAAPSASINAPVYNTYSINVPVTQPGASADEIANKVMTKIKNVDNSSIRRINGY